MIRLWKLGNLEHRMAPINEAAEKLAALLADHKPGELMDLIWGPDIEIEVVPDYPDEPITDVIRIIRQGVDDAQDKIHKPEGGV